MPIPKMFDITYPLLCYAGAQQHFRIDDAIDVLGNTLGLTETDKTEMLPSGAEPRFANRVRWARTELKMAGLLATPERGKLCITDTGREALSLTNTINRQFLMQYPAYAAYFTKGEAGQEQGNGNGNGKKLNIPMDDSNVLVNPEEALEESYQTLRDELARELLSRVMQENPAFFEKLVVDLLVAMGYGGSRKDAGSKIGKSGDDGIDGIIKEDKLGLDAIYIQAKRWQEGNVVGRPQVQAFAGSLEGVRARKGVFITTSRFTKEALEYVKRIEKKIILIDGVELTQLMIEYGVGVSETRRYVLKKIDYDYFDAE